jgi:sulfur carrier protein
LNGQARSFENLEENASLVELVAELGLKSDRIAVERNGAIAPRTGWAGVVLGEGDRIEIVHFVGGGSVGL